MEGRHARDSRAADPERTRKVSSGAALVSNCFLVRLTPITNQFFYRMGTRDEESTGKQADRHHAEVSQCTNQIRLSRGQ